MSSKRSPPSSSAKPPQGGPESVAGPFRRAERLTLVLMAGFALRAMRELGEGVPGGLNAGLVLLDVLVADHQRASAESARGESDRVDGIASEPRTVSVTSRATGIPRETVRRHLADLLRAGWLKDERAGGFVADERGRLGFALCRDGATVADFLRIVVRLRDLQRLPAADLDTAISEFPWRGAMATRQDDVVEPVWEAELAQVREWLDRLPAAARMRCGAMTDGYLYRHLKRLREAFDGDLMLPLILGEIGHHNISRLSHVPAKRLRISELERILEPDRRTEEPRYRPVNAHSLSLSMDIPNATMRRKLALLFEQGLIVVEPNGALSISGAVVPSTAPLNASTFADLQACFDELDSSGLLPSLA